MGWLDDILTNAGNSLVGAQQPFGSLMGPPDPAQRQAMINSALLTLGGTLSQAGRQGVGPMEAIGTGFQNLSAQGQQRGQQQLQSALLMSKIGEQQKRNQTLETLSKTKPPAGMDPDMWKAMVTSDPGEAFKLYAADIQRQRTAAAYGGGDSAPGMPIGGGGTTPGAPAPSGGGFNIGNLRAQGGGFQTFGSPEEAVAAAVRNVQAYPGRFNQGQPMTLLQVGERWAPKGDGANDPVQWARNVGQIGGLPVDQPLDFRNPQIAERFARGVHGAEFGQGAAYQPDIYRRGAAAALNPSIMRTGAPQAPAGQPSPVQPTQYTPPGQGAPAASGSDPASDPGIAALRQAQRKALMVGDEKQAGAIEVEIAKRRGALADRPYELERSQSQGRERAQIMRDAEVLKADVKDAAEYAQGIQNNALKARSTVANVQQLDALLDRVGTGRFTGSTVELKRIAKGLGINMDALGITDNVGTAEAARALSNQLTLQMRELAGGMPGAMSDPDRRFLEAMIPGLETSPEGRKLMIGYMKRMLEHSIGLAKEISKYRQSPDWKTNPQGIIDVASRYGDQNRIFREEDIAAVTRARGAAPAPTSPIAEPQAAAPVPKPGDVMDGYRFKGGDPGKPGNWEKVR